MSSPARVPPPKAHVSALLDCLQRPDNVGHLDPEDRERLLRVARRGQLLAEVAVRLVRAGVDSDVGTPFGRQLAGARAEAAYRRHRVVYEAGRLAEALARVGAPLLLLKGAAYAIQSLPLAEGRLPRDLDVLVPLGSLKAVETALLESGWEFSKDLTEYDQHYYRAWSHELPPLRLPGHAFELDLHHSILPPIGRLKPDAARLLADSVPVADSPFRVLRPADQVLHAAVHLFQDSDCVGRLRDLVDIDGLIRHFSVRDGERFWQQLGDSTAVHGLGRPLWYALAFCGAWLRTPVPEGFWEQMQNSRPPALSRRLMTSLAARVLPPVHPDREPGPASRAAASALEFRALWLRMPPWTLAYHGASKLARLLRKPAGQSAAG